MVKRSLDKSTNYHVKKTKNITKIILHKSKTTTESKNNSKYSKIMFAIFSKSDLKKTYACNECALKISEIDLVFFVFYLNSDISWNNGQIKKKGIP